ncbi:MAG: nitroreductase family protein [Burkholderiaceae bacterium]|nr:nitroreductase family protein [Burkholderiaceae bacterium]
MPEAVHPTDSVETVETTETARMASALIQSRQTILPKRLGSPGPTAAQLQDIVGAAAHAPDHGQLLPWRFVVVPDAARALLAEVFAQALYERDCAALPDQLEQAREKAYRSPVLMLAVVDGACGDADIDLAERTVSAGCAIQNMLLMATALGYGSSLTSGKALKAQGLRRLFELADAEHALCFINIGTIVSRKPLRMRPAAHMLVSKLSADGQLSPGF